MSILMLVITAITATLNWICRIVARLSAWSPSGRRVEFRLGEGPASVMARTYFGTIEGFQPRERRTGTLLLSLELPVDIGAASEEIVRKRVLATARFRGDTPYRLIVGPLDINLATPGGGDETESPRLIANGTIRLLPREL
jgi:hypothetical protein